MGCGAFGRCAVGVAAVTDARGISRAFDLEVLHAREEPEQLIGDGIAVEAAAIHREQKFVGCLQSREAAVLRLLFDHVTTRGRGREHDARQALQAWA